MSDKITKTLQGNSLDMEALALRNEKTRAVGNMNTNATGVQNANDTVATGTRRPNKALRKNHSKIVQDAPVMNSKRAALELAYKFLVSEEAKGVDESLDTIVEISKTPMEKPKPKVINPVITPKPVMHKPSPITRMPQATPEAIQPQAPVEEVSDELLQEVINRTNTGGLAGAIAKAQEVKQEQLKTPREEQRSVSGVKKI